MAFKLAALTLLLSLAGHLHCWNNGLARTPPMGWLSWTKFACNTDCKHYPHECINEQLYKDMVDRLAADGYLEHGYNTVNIDDCWSEKLRDPVTKRLIADHVRFPSGIKALADYAHGKKVQLGIYSDVGTKTCAGYPSTRSDNVDHTTIDAQTFSDWGVDSLKLDMCNADVAHFNESYPEFTKAFEKVTHKIVYACSWPMRYVNKLTEHDYETIRDNCNYWRNYGDINDSWQSVLHIIDFYAKNAQIFAKYHGPGGWFDPDMIIIGNDGLSYEQSKTQMAFWCLWSAPLLMSNDLRDIKPEFKEILLNKHLIAVNQDPLGIMGHRVKHEEKANKEVWIKKLSPLPNGLNPYVVLYFNYHYMGVPATMSYTLSELIPELKTTVKYEVHDLFGTNGTNGTKFETLSAHDKLTLRVKISGSVRMVKLVPV